MFISHMRMPRRALATLSGIVCLMLSGASAPAQTVVETVHYQAQIDLVCESVVCAGVFEKPGAKRRLNVTRMTCAFTGSPNKPFRYGAIELRRADGTHVLFQYLPPGHSSAIIGFHSINHAVDMQVSAQQYIFVELVQAGGNAISGSCTASGTLDRLQ
jgi:hypothetical protein